MTNAERLVFLKRSRLELQRVRDELDVATLTCTRCKAVTGDEQARELDHDLGVVIAKLSCWIEVVGVRRPSSQRVSSEA